MSYPNPQDPRRGGGPSNDQHGDTNPYNNTAPFDNAGNPYNPQHTGHGTGGNPIPSHHANTPGQTHNNNTHANYNAHGGNMALGNPNAHAYGGYGAPPPMPNANAYGYGGYGGYGVPPPLPPAANFGHAGPVVAHAAPAPAHNLGGGFGRKPLKVPAQKPQAYTRKSDRCVVCTRWLTTAPHTHQCPGLPVDEHGRPVRRCGQCEEFLPTSRAHTHQCKGYPSRR